MKINILFILPSLRPGGAERVLSFLSQNLDKNHFKTSLLITGRSSRDDYRLEGVDLKYLNKNKVRAAIPDIIRHLNTNNYHVVMGAIGHVNLTLGLLSLFYPQIKFIGRETTLSQSNYKFKFSLSKIIRRSIYLMLDKIVCQSKDMKDEFVKNFNFPEERIIVINNPITSNFSLKQRLNRNKKLQFITVGRLDPIKGHVRILNALKNLNIPFHYTYIGDGPEASKISEYIELYKLRNQVTHIPFTEEVPKYLSDANIFLQGSYIEGFPNALLESCAVGTPVLAFEAKGGTKEIIVDGKNGFIARNEEEFFNLLEESINIKWNPEVVRDSVVSKFSENKILSQYEKLFQKITNN